MDSPLNLAHQQARRADHVLKSGKFEDAIFCHKRAAEHILDAMQLTVSNHALESLKLQHQYHLKQQDFIRGRQHRAEQAAREDTKAKQIVEAMQKCSPLSETLQSPNNKSSHAEIGDEHILSDTESIDVYKTMADTDSLLQYLANRHYGNCSLKDIDSLKEWSPRTKSTAEILAGAVKSPKGEKTVIEELRMHTEELRKHILAMLKELETSELKRAHLAHKLEQFEHAQALYLDNVDADDIKLPSLELPPLEMPHFDFELAKSLAANTLDQSKQGTI